MSSPAERAGEALGARVTGARRVAGGDLNEALRLELEDGRRAFVKWSPDAPAGGYAAEAAGLRWLEAAPGGPPVPEVLAVRDDFLVLAWVEPTPGGLGAAGEEELGRRLAATGYAGGDLRRDLYDWMGRENFEERWHDGRLDPVVLEHLRSTTSGS